MTGPNANFAFGMADISGTYSRSMDTNKKAKEASSDIPFAALMGQSMGMTQNSQKAPTNGVETDTQSDLFDMANSIDANGKNLKVKLNNSTAGNNSSLNPGDTKTSGKPDKNAVEAASGAISQISGNVSKEISEELGVSEDQIEAAMENLGLSYMDLINPENLEALVTELSSLYSDVNASLADIVPTDVVAQMMPQIDSIIGDALSENGISLEEFGEFFEAVSAGDIELPEEIKDLLPQTSQQGAGQSSEADISVNVTLPMKTEDASSLRGTTESAVQVIKLVDEEIIDENGDVSEDALLDGEVIEDSALNMKSDDSSSQNENSNNNESGRGSDARLQNANDMNAANHFRVTDISNEATANTANTVTGNATLQSFEQTVAQVEQVTSYTSQQTNDIINQIITRASTTITETVSRMEMELNPQSLGRMIMQVQQQDGVLVARLIAQNESVKEALETQLAQLRVSLESKGIKVEAVEVSVGTHEFEQALEEGMGQTFSEEAERDNREELPRQRNLHIDDLEEIADELTEEEALAASIMRDNGGTVDYSA